jgi:hypothetical protein
VFRLLSSRGIRIRIRIDDLDLRANELLAQAICAHRDPDLLRHLVETDGLRFDSRTLSATIFYPFASGFESASASLQCIRWVMETPVGMASWGAALHLPSPRSRHHRRASHRGTPQLAVMLRYGKHRAGLSGRFDLHGARVLRIVRHRRPVRVEGWSTSSGCVRLMVMNAYTVVAAACKDMHLRAVEKMVVVVVVLRFATSPGLREEYDMAYNSERIDISTLRLLMERPEFEPPPPSHPLCNEK